MAAGMSTGLVTVAEFEKLNRKDLHFELHHGEVFTMPPPAMPHFWAARRLRKELERLLQDMVVDREVPFRPLPEYEVWVADVAALLQERADQARSQWLAGVPDLVIEILSPSNRKGPMGERRDICLRNGGRQFWVVDLEAAGVEVSTRAGTMATFGRSGTIDLSEFGGGQLSMNQIFPG